MIRKFIDRWLGKPGRPPGAPDTAPAPATPPVPEPAIPLGRRVEVPAAEHGIDPALLDANAVRVVRTLKDAGHEAYIVGGAVRDLLVGLRPKDFDVATDATPEQVKALFRRAFIIGRRFRLVHVVFGRGREHETIEVSTFRAYLDASAAEATAGNEKTMRREDDRQHVVDASGRVLRDNVWGPQVEDAARRDVTVNAMYYDPVTQVVVDYHGGLADARARVLRLIGDPASRYREDPVRIVRVVRFAAKLGFAIEPATEAPIRPLAASLANVPPSRLFDEVVKLLQTGHGVASTDELRRRGLVGIGVFPLLDVVLAPPRPGSAADQRREAFVRLALENTDHRVAEGRSVVPSFLLACLLWHEVQERAAAISAQGEGPFQALAQAVDAVFDARIGDISGRGRLAADMREVWLMQPRFERRTGSSAASLVAQPRFRAGYDFLRLRADVGEVAPELADWWEDFHLGSDEDRAALLEAVRTTPQRRRVPGKGVAPAPAPRPHDLDLDLSSPPAPPAPAEPGPTIEAADGADDAAPARRRRRRRRRPLDAGAGAAEGDTAAAPDTP
jgi:poly(A) polymerase